MKTIKDLNNNMLYRLIKIIYIIFITFVTFFLSITIYDTLSDENIITTYFLKSNYSKTKVHTPQKFAKNVQNMIDGNSIDFDTAYNETLNFYKKNWIQIEWVNIDQELQSNTKTKVAEGDKLIGNLNFIIRLSKSLILSFIISYIIFFQLLNRIFYYVVIWNFNPKKE